MRTARNISLVLFLVFFIVAVGGGLFWGNMNFVRRVPGGADFIVSWKAVEDFAMRGVSPYEEETMLDIQRTIYGRPLRPGEYPYRVDVPLNTLILFILPLLGFKLLGLSPDLIVIRTLWMMVLEIALAALVIFSLRLARWKPSWVFLFLIFLFSVFWMPFVSTLVTGSSIILQAFLLFGALRAIELQTDELGGAMAALALVNLEATGMIFIAIVVWAVSTQRWRVLYGFGMMWAILVGLSFVLQSSWILPFIRSLVGNWRSGALPSTFSLFEGWFPGIGQRLAQILAVGALTILFMEWRAVRQQDVRWLFWTACLSAAVTPLLGFSTVPSWLALTLPGVLLVLSVMVQRWGVLGWGSAVLTSAIFFLGLWAAQIGHAQAVFVLVYPLVLTILLYWVRWWAVRPPRVWADQISLKG